MAEGTDTAVLNAVSAGNESNKTNGQTLNTIQKDLATNGKNQTAAINSVGQAVSSLGDGISADILSLTEATTSAAQENTNSILAAFKGYFAEVAKNIVDINTTMLGLKENSDGNLEITEKESEEAISEDAKVDSGNLDTSIAEPGGLKAVKTAAGINAAGFAMLFGSFKNLGDQITGSLSELGKIQVASQAKVTADESSKKKGGEGGGGDTQDPKVFTNFLKEAAGPLQSVATATLAITASLAVLSMLPITPGVGLTVVGIMFATMIGAFTLIALLSSLYIQHQNLIDPDKKGEKGNLIGMIDAFSNMVLKFSLSFMLMLFTITLVQANAGNFCMVLIGVGSILFMSIKTANALSSQTKSEVEKDDGIFQLLDTIANMVLKLTVSIIILGLIPYHILLRGVLFATILLAECGGMVIALSNLMKSTDTKKDQIEEYAKLMKSITNLVLIMGILVIVLGIMPISIISQGLTTVSLIMGLVLLMTFGFTKIFASMPNPAKINAITNFIKSITIVVAVVSILVIVLGVMPIEVLIQGFVAMIAIFALIWVAAKFIPQIKIQPQVFIALAMIAVFALALAACGAIIALVFSLIPGGPTAVLISALALVAITFAFIVIGYTSNLLVPLGIPAMAALIPFKLLGIAYTLIVAVALAGAAVTLASIISPELAVAAATVAVSTAKIAIALVSIGWSTAALAGLFWVLFWTTNRAKKATRLILDFMRHMSWIVWSISQIWFDTSALSKIGEFATGIQSFTSSIVSLAATIVPASAVMIAMLVPLYIVANGMWKLCWTLGWINWTLHMFENLQPVNQEVVTSRIQGIQDNVNLLQQVANTINKFQGTSAAATRAVVSTLLTVRALNTMMELPANRGGGTSGIDHLADALGRLAETAPGLQAVASSMREVASAANELGNLNVNTKQSIEMLTKGGGSAEGLKEDVEAVKAAKKPREDKGESEQVEKLDQILAALNNIAGAMSGISANQQKQTDSFNRNSNPQSTASLSMKV